MVNLHTVPIALFMSLFLPHANQATDESGDAENVQRLVEARSVAPPPNVQFKEVCFQDTELKMYTAFAEAVNGSGVARTYRVSKSKDRGMNVSGLYPAEHMPSTSLPRWEFLEASVHCFLPGEDPFSDSETPTRSTRARENEEEIYAHAGRVMSRQQRTHLFVVILIGELARLVRIDRTTLVVSDPFSYVEQPHTLAEFFWRFSSLSRPQRGHDVTASPVLPGTELHSIMVAAGNSRISGAADYARRCFQHSLDSSWPWWRLQVHEPGKNAQGFLVAKPVASKEDFKDRRGSRGYVALALDQPGRPFVFLKDAWRWVQDSIEAEGATLARLNERGVRNVPTLVCHGDLPGQRISLKSLWELVHGRAFPVAEGKRAPPDIILTHYRMVVREVGMPLEEFHNGRELVQIIRDCVQAHRDAYAQAKTLHRDISPGNMLIVPVDKDGTVVRRGLLMDWELCERVDLRDGVKGLGRRGTYQFLSVRCMENRSTYVAVADELEAFFHVIVKLALRLLPHNCRDVHVLHDDYFRLVENGTSHSTCGALKRQWVVTGDMVTHDGEELVFLIPQDPIQCGRGPRMRVAEMHPMQDLLQGILFWTEARYARLAAELEPPSAVKENQPGGEYDARPATAQPRAPVTPPRAPLGNANLNRADPGAPGRPDPGPDGAPSTSDDCAKFESDDLSTFLDRHDAFLQLLDMELQRDDWPAADKVRDRLAEDSDDDATSAASDSGGDDDASEEDGSGRPSFDDADSSDGNQESSEEGRPMKRGRSDDFDADCSDARVALMKRMRR
ncbi:hypothetical protein BV20DRAFT_421703 [Pilatotrama ljubarskyi]|nr:hypothetical protein BV20DRAFT_421703 [Pilatotrama ljubarskyi]